MRRKLFRLHGCIYPHLGKICISRAKGLLLVASHSQESTPRRGLHDVTNLQGSQGPLCCRLSSHVCRGKADQLELWLLQLLPRQNTEEY